MLKELVEITEDRHKVILDLRYCTENNFTKKILTDDRKCYLRPEAEDRLAKAVNLAGKLNLKLKLFDGFRAQSVQERLWEHTPNSNFITPPEKGSPHTRGVAIDLTLYDPHADENLDMGTDFDDFTDRSFHGASDISQTAMKNRCLLLGLMSTAGWDFYMNEWWHYQLFHSRDYSLL